MVRSAIPVLCAALAAAGSACAQPLEPWPPTERRMDPGAAPVSVAAREAMVTIPAGTYPIGDADGLPSARPAHRVQLDPFRIDRTEVTNAAFAEYLNALELEVRAAFPVTKARFDDFAPATARRLLEQGRAEGLYPIIGLDDAQVRIHYEDGAFRPADGYAEHPVAETTWAGARDYCLWRGGRLPTEAEWEAAARGREGRSHPWGEAPPSDDRVYAGHRSGNTAPVGSRPAGATPRGLLDMAGSEAEWTSSLFRPYPYDRNDGREDPTHPGERVTRGGDYVFDTAPDQLTTYFRDGFSRAPMDGHRHIGFRCAADAQ